jgi:hypothetical protein
MYYKMDLVVILMYLTLIYLYVIMYMVKGNGIWKNLELYVPDWSEKYLMYIMIYLFILLVGLYWAFILKTSNKVLRNSQSLIIGVIMILFAFSIYCLADNTTSIEEAFVLSSIILALLIYNFITTFVGYNSVLSILAVLPLTVYAYIYVWVYEIKNSY